MTNATCLIWGTPATSELPNGDYSWVDSPRAGGLYKINGSAEEVLKCNNKYDDKFRVKLTSWLVDQRRLGVDRPEISSSTLDEVAKMRPLPVYNRADCLLRYLNAKSDLLGAVVEFQSNNKGVTETELLAWTASRELSEVITLAEYCHEEGWIEVKFRGDMRIFQELMLRPPGYARLAELDGTNVDSQQAFVAMWFDASMDDCYQNGILPAINDAGYKEQLIKHKQHINKIDDEIIAEIKRSRFLVADFTQGEDGARGGVYYEAGFAKGLDIPVIFTCREDVIKEVHFDTRQYNHILWETPEDLREQLKQRILAIIGEGPLKPDS
jgi:hypothetical protein